MIVKEALIAAKELARKHGCFIVTCPDKYLIYREMKPKNLCVGKAKTAEGIIKLTEKICRNA